jgi:Ca-activated chloride channel family protein
MKKNEISKHEANHAGLFLTITVIIAIFLGCNSPVNFEGGNPNGHPSTYDTAEPELAEEAEFNTEEYSKINENTYQETLQNPLSTFSIDVDNASYSNIRRYLTAGQLPPADAVRIEEMINYFDYNYPQPSGDHPFSIYNEVAVCPWNKDNLLVHIGLQGKSIDYENLKSSNLVFLIDVSGSMDESNKLPLVKKSMEILVENLNDQDKVAMVVYAGNAGLVLPSTSVKEKDKILEAIDDLEAGGSTAGGEGLQLAYKIAKQNLLNDGNNRVILCTDGDFNVGISATSELVRFIEEKRKEDIYLTICGFGMGNYKDDRLEEISNAGNGNYFYIDNRKEAEKVFSKELRANLFTIAKDVKIQVEFNPQTVEAYRLIGYENRILAQEDFNNDQKDAGELGAGHTVTALYEIVPNGKPYPGTRVDKLKYQKTSLSPDANDKDLLTVKLRYKPIKSENSNLLSEIITTDEITGKPSANFRFSAAVAEFGMLLRNSEFKGSASFSQIGDLAKGTTNDPDKEELLELIGNAERLADK